MTVGNTPIEVVDERGRFKCIHLRCTLSQVACAARYRMALAGRKEVQGSPCGDRCNVGRALGKGKPLPQHFVPLRELVAPKARASRDKAWGYANCLQCGLTFKKGSGNHLWFCQRRCAKKFYRPYKPPRPGAEEMDAVKKQMPYGGAS